MFPCPCIFKLNQIKFKQAPLSHLIGTGQQLCAVQEASGEPNNLSTDAKYNVLIAAKLRDCESSTADNVAYLSVEGVVDPGHDPVDPVRLGEELLGPGLVTGLRQRLAQPHQQPRHHARAVPVVESEGKIFRKLQKLFEDFIARPEGGKDCLSIHGSGVPPLALAGQRVDVVHGLHVDHIAVAIEKYFMNPRKYLTETISHLKTGSISPTHHSHSSS